ALVPRLGTQLRAVSSYEPDGTTTATLARDTGLARPTAHRLLTSLQAEGLVDRNARGRWLLGPELYLLGAAAARRYDVTAVARASVHRLAEATGESAFFSARRGDETVCLLREDGSFPIRSHVLHEGIRFPLGVASAGLAILAFLPDREVGAYLAGRDLSVDHGRAHRPRALRTRLAETRARGYAVNPGLLVEGSWGIGAAVFDAAGSPRWALSLTGIEARFSADRLPVMGRQLLQEAHRLSQRLEAST
ncbi:MAG: allR, partial [Nocardioidaceae bacterium]|nr:allR [Nocardioidaceae bacterium]